MILNKIFFILMTLFITLQNGNTMEPAEFDSNDNVKFFNAKTGNTLISNFDDESPSVTLHSKNKKKLWTIPQFMGRNLFELSPNDEKILIYGDFYFGTRSLQLNPDAVVATVFDKGKLILEVRLKELYKDPKKAAAELDLSIKGGNWVDWTGIISSLKVDWMKSSLQFQLKKSTVVKNF